MREYRAGADGFRRLTVEEVAPGLDRITFWERMGCRWVQLGPSELWSRAASLELFDDYEEVKA